MAGAGQNAGGDGLGEPLLPSQDLPQHLSEEVPEELPQDKPSLQQPQLILPYDEEKEEETEEDSDRTEDQFDGVLSEDIVAEGLHKLGRSAPGIEYVYLNLSLSGRELSDINILSKYIHLQKLELSNNKINDLSCVSHMPYLLELNASNNELTTYFSFKPPKNLKEVDFSYNQIPKMQDLSAYQSLTKLLLDFNNIEEIRGLEKCHSLTHLSLSHNKLVAISGLENLPIKILNLSSNQIEKITGLDSLKTLQKLDLSRNKITSLQGLEEHDLLEMINLEDNQEQTDYWLSVIFTLLRLTELDLKNISVEEKVAAVNQYDPPPEVVAARDHITQVMYSMLQPQRILDSPCHTTRAAYFGEENRLDYYFVSQEAFDKMVKTGKFIATYKYSGYYYGLGQETVESVAREGLATCVHLEVEGARSLKNTYFKPRYILLVPTNKEKYEGHLRRKGLFSRPEIEEAVSRVDMYIKISQDDPGFFDAVVNTDDMDEAFTELSFLIKSYLGLEQPADSDSTQDFHIRARAGSRIKLLQEQRLSPGGVIAGATQSSPVNEFLESSTKIYPGGTSDRLPVQLSSVEEASLQRRRSAARQALSGKAPSAYIQLFQRDLAVTPALSSSHQKLLEPIPASLLSGGRNVSTDLSFPLIKPESSSRESGPATGQFLTSAGASAAEGLTVRAPHGRLTEEPKAEHRDLRGAESGADRQKETDLTSDNLQRKHSKSKAGSAYVPELISWAGSHAKPVLPPIPPGRKKTNP
ncbi:leucine-rich repeat and guanylate kinase domain-containing protein isoform X2 [Dryobates pubescens]|uniref:leucine-rich repeat and guanylate kinase domain-containing protein isoform X2 n=1 Tax=Dryobates pubescens TaxID=118200 RepID=UPI0023B9EBCE|nr:leucine-rich repeat and guanylate kinase domain-containing protein isoform X2 [Dryobates pubescens]